MTVALARTHAHEMPATVQFIAIEHEIEVALGVALVRVAVRDPAATIPDHDGAPTIFAFRDRALERIVFDRMVFDLNGQALLAGIEARAARDRPAS